MEKQRQRANKTTLILSFLIPLALMTVVFAILKITPFGDNSLLITDMDGQYIDFFSYFKDMFKENNNFFYTFSKNLGGDMVGFTAYYLLSPFNLLLFLFPQNMFPEIITLIAILKLATCGLVFNYFLQKRFSTNCISSIIFSTSYALMAYNVAYIYSFMWLDVVAITPLIILGLEKLLRGKKPVVYIISLSLALIFNYYIGFMLCIFSVLYFIFRSILEKPKPYIVKRYIVSSLLSGGLASFLLIPVFRSLKGGKAGLELENFYLYNNFNLLDFFSKTLTGSINKEQIMSKGMPNVFCGIFILILVILFFLNTKIPKKEKIISGVFLGILFLSFWISTLNIIWHGFNSPVWFPFRYSFLFSFLLILYAYKCFLNLDGIKKKHLILSIIIAASFAILTVLRRLDFLNEKIIFFDLLLIILFPLCFFIFKNFKSKKLRVPITIVIIIFHFGNLTLNAGISIEKLLETKASDYKDYVSQVAPVFDKIKKQDNGFYRMEKTFERTFNDSMQFSYNGLTHYSSSEKEHVKEFSESLGFKHIYERVRYDGGSTVSVDKLFGVKYLLSKEKNISKPFEFLFEENGIYVFENPKAFSIGFTADKDILGSIRETNNPFEKQNSIFEKIKGEKTEPIYTSVEDVAVSTENLEMDKEGSHTLYKKIDAKKDAFINYKIQIQREEQLYFYFSAPKIQKAKILVNGTKLTDYFTPNSWNAMPVGNYKIGDTVDLAIELTDKELKLDNFYFYFENIDMLNKYCETSENAVIEKISSSNLKGKISVKEDNQVLLFTIPSEKGWTIKIDGKNVEPKEALNVFTAIELEKGNHIFEMKYTPPGFYAGIIISLLSLGLMILLLKFKKHEWTK